ncbi:MAG: hypothetical protein GTO55_11565 [Armatimonadetes bacterium]|nr:hypothetical protein [Armatimonadota bacterium]NIM24853.1 hypothetical protein [Armatimonadota bacterium]NIM68743.1 hypothetical protein [Armatimonadota bacterium]NIM76036.1 hypothetical protein [Armatimonadota bacterium]NIN06940.1 hypothetical protein [Armatimonadota bacterium]
MEKKTQKPRHPNGMGALIIGIVLTIIGGGLLVERITGLPVWDHLWKFWPVLLIVMGVKILVDHYLARAASRSEE